MVELDEAEREFVEIVDQYGWHVMKVFGEEDGEPGFAYTTGLWKNYGHPELIMVGVPIESAHAILNGMGRDIRDEVRTFQAGGPVKGVVEGFGVYFVDFDWSHVRQYFGWALWYYGTFLDKPEQFPILQCVWPAKGNGSYPWESEWPEDLKIWQPLLGPSPAIRH